MKKFENNPEWLGSDYRWQSLSTYLSKSDRRKLLAFRSYYWTRLSGNVPYLICPRMAEIIQLILAAFAGACIDLW